MTVTKTIYGDWQVSAMVDGYRVQKMYSGYTKKEAVALFKAEHNVL